MLRLEAQQQNAMLALPESGMGYQRVEFEYADEGRRTGTLLNATLLVLDSEHEGLLNTRSFAMLVENARAARPREIRDIRLMRGTPQASRVREGRSSGEAKDAPVELCKAGEVFKRFSAFPNDNRVQQDGSLLPGTYVTTEADAVHVKTGSDAVKRYALPNPDPASWVYTSKPHTGTKVQRGIVAPANGQTGGGVEVIFTDGTQRGTTSGPVKIPD